MKQDKPDSARHAGAPDALPSAQPSAQTAAHFGDTLGYRMLQAGHGVAVFEVDIHPGHCNRYGTVHGGVALALADAAGLWAGARDDGTLEQASTASLTCNFLKAAQCSQLRARGQLSKRGRQLYFANIEVTAEPGGALVATASGVYAIAPKPGKG